MGGTQSSPRNRVRGGREEEQNEERRDTSSIQPYTLRTCNETDFSIVLSSLASGETIQGVPSASKVKVDISTTSWWIEFKKKKLMAMKREKRDE